MAAFRQAQADAPVAVANHRRFAIYYVPRSFLFTDDAAGKQRLSSVLKPLRIDLGVSWLLAAGLAATYGCAIVVVTMSPLPAPLAGLAALALAIGAVRDVLRCVNPVSPYRIQRLLLNDTGEWFVINGAGESFQGRPIDAPLVHPWMVAYTLRAGDGKRQSVLVLPDMAEPTQLHALRLWLAQRTGVDPRHRRNQNEPG